MKCLNTDSCRSFATNWFQVFPERFVPFPAVYGYAPDGMKAVDPNIVFLNPKSHIYAPLRERLIQKPKPECASKFEVVAFDIYCPSMKEKIQKEICTKCNKYWPSKAAMKRHSRCHSRIVPSILEIDDSDSDNDSNDQTASAAPSRMPVFENIFYLFKSSFIGNEKGDLF